MKLHVIRVEFRYTGNNLDHSAYCLAAVERRRRSANNFNSFDRGGWHVGEVRRRRASKNGIVERHTVNEMQDGRSFQATNNRRTLSRRRLLQIDADV